jgi:hypothetical protein
VLGVSTNITEEIVAVLDVARREERKRGEESNFAEIGLRIAPTEKVMVALGGALGFDDESADYTVTAGLQLTF